MITIMIIIVAIFKEDITHLTLFRPNIEKSCCLKHFQSKPKLEQNVN